jgi:hypothetical protein
MRLNKTLLLSACTATALAATTANAAPADNAAPKVQVSYGQLGPILHSLRGAAYRPGDFSKGERVHMVRPVPSPVFPENQIDGAVQGQGRNSTSAAPTLGTSVLGVGQGFTGPQGNFSVNSAPPDTVGEVGATQYVQVVNTGLAVFSKSTKAVIYGPVPTNTLWQGFGGLCEADNDGDATVVYDKAAQRWIVSQFAVSGGNMQCVAVSQTSDATGAWNRYAFDYGTSFPDYPKMGVWPDAYYETFNIFNGNSFAGAKLCAYDRAAMLSGAQALQQQCFQLSSSFGGVLPADADGALAPPAGSPNYLLNFGTNSLNLWKFHVDWAVPSNSSLTGPINIPVASFSPGCGGGACVLQANIRQKLDSLGDRLMFRLGYRHFADGHESLVVNHSVKAGTTRKDQHTGVRWYEIRSPGTTPVVYQQSTFAPDTSYRWMGSAAMDKQGNLGIGYSVSSSSLFPGIRYTGRLATDPLNTLQTEATIINGGGSQNGGLNRWGDYSALTVDPADDCTFWYTTEYLQNTGSFNWSTRIASFKFPTCL